MQQIQKAACLKAALFFSLISCFTFLLTGCGKNKVVPQNSNNNSAITASIDREKEIERARGEAQAYLAANPPTTVTAKSKPGTRSLANAQASAEALSRNFLKALANKDMESIKALRLTKDEFCQYVFPELPSSKLPNVTCDFVWQQATLKSLSGLSEMYPEHQGKKYEFVALRFEKGTDSYPTYNVHKETHLMVKDETGKQQELRLFGSILEMDGRYKLISFVID
jgi:adenine-specific DNA methylase